MAIACAGGAAAWLFAILTLPMSLSVIASMSQDALMLACTALAAALLVRLLRWPEQRNGRLLTVLVIMLVLVATARVTNAGLALLPLALTTFRLRSRVLAAAAVAGCAAIWSGIASATALSNFGGPFGYNPTAQLAGLLAHPLAIGPLAWHTLALYWPSYADSFIGRLGWLDTGLPWPYHVAAWAMLGVAAVAAMLGLRGKPIGVVSRLAIVAGVLAATGALFAIQYLTWTDVGKAVVDGVQGRHLLPIAVAGAALLPALGDTRLERLHKPLVLVVAAFPLITVAVVTQAVVVRYYLG